MYVNTNKSTMYYEKTNSNGQDIIILPGWGNTKETFKYIIDYFKDNNRIFIMDYPGFGMSEEPKEELLLEDYIELILKMIEKEKITNPIIIAHSFGGRLVSILNEKINIKELILIDVAGIKRFNLKLYLKTKIFKIIKKLNKKLAKKIEKNFSSSDYKDLSPIMKKTFNNIIKVNLKSKYKKIKTETLIIWGEKDEDTPLKDAYLLKKVIKDSALIIYKNKHHYSYLEDVYLTNRIIENIIKKDEEN